MKFGAKTNSNLVHRLNSKVDGDVQLCYFRPEIHFLGKIGPKTENLLFEIKFVTETTNSNMQNSMVMLNLLVLDRKYSFWAISVQKFKIVLTNLNFQKSIMILIFSDLDQKHAC